MMMMMMKLLLVICLEIILQLPAIGFQTRAEEELRVSGCRESNTEQLVLNQTQEQNQTSALRGLDGKKTGTQEDKSGTSRVKAGLRTGMRKLKTSSYLTVLVVFHCIIILTVRRAAHRATGQEEVRRR
ncbi:unnamed protein product [Pleuronectes platessa]|uniref:Uncharacterized protein n=1 Tax=Pleuronectes platessa TaxID=8262 RepID=A0A9N7Y8C0_PLEPL|nr:unnamed protein product [Pleuronectes platessa]